MAGPGVIIVGAGVGGMTVAHELAERGVPATVIEARPIPGGKSRSMDVPGTGQGGRRDLEGEHGFRFFPEFYQNVPDTMRRIPFGNNPRGVYDNLRVVPRANFASHDGALLFPTRRPQSVDDVTTLARFLRDFERLGIPQDELNFFGRRLHLCATACDARRYGELDDVSWWDFIGAEARSPAYRKYLATGMMRNLVAARPEHISARTGGTLLLQLLYGAFGRGPASDRVLCGPTNRVWFDPWVAHLRSLGVEFRFGAAVEEILVEGGRIAGLRVRMGESVHVVRGDHYVLAVPAEVAARKIHPALCSLDPALARIQRLRTDWMVGIQFYLRAPLDIVDGHSNFYDSPWALTSIEQARFWPEVDLSRHGDGTVREILSVDISEWDRPGLNGKAARDCTADEIAREVLAQIKQHVPAAVRERIDRHVVCYHLDPDLECADGERPARNRSSLLINTVGSWRDRPEAATRIPNFYLAADYVRTSTDLATMEGANEAGRRAVNALIERSGLRAPPCRVFTLREPVIFAAERLLDALRFHAGRPHRLGALDPSRAGRVAAPRPAAARGEPEHATRGAA